MQRLRLWQPNREPNLQSVATRCALIPIADARRHMDYAFVRARDKALAAFSRHLEEHAAAGFNNRQRCRPPRQSCTRRCRQSTRDCSPTDGCGKCNPYSSASSFTCAAQPLRTPRRLSLPSAATQGSARGSPSAASAAGMAQRRALSTLGATQHKLEQQSAPQLCYSVDAQKGPWCVAHGDCSVK